MVRIAISQAAFDAIAATLPLGSVSFENATNGRGERYVWLDPTVINRLRALRGPGEDYSYVILKLVAAARAGRSDEHDVDLLERAVAAVSIQIPQRLLNQPRDLRGVPFPWFAGRVPECWYNQRHSNIMNA